MQAKGNSMRASRSIRATGSQITSHWTITTMRFNSSKQSIIRLRTVKHVYHRSRLKTWAMCLCPRLKCTLRRRTWARVARVITSGMVAYSILTRIKQSRVETRRWECSIVTFRKFRWLNRTQHSLRGRCRPSTAIRQTTIQSAWSKSDWIRKQTNTRTFGRSI